MANINTVFPRRGARCGEIQLIRALPMFSEEKVKEARNDSLHLHTAARHVDARPVCLFVLALHSPEGRKAALCHL